MLCATGSTWTWIRRWQSWEGMCMPLFSSDALKGTVERLNGRTVERSNGRSYLNCIAVAPFDRLDSAKEDEKAFLELMEKAVVSGAKPFIILNLLGLGNVLDTFVGDETLRGVSGGEKKRVTTAEVMVGPQGALFMDEISTGLDSATTYSVVQSLRNASHSFERTIVISLLQPAPEVMDLFDDLLLLTDGKVLYHGPVQEALPFFARLGFDCPARKDPGSFLQEVTSPIGQRMYASTALLKKHGLTEEDRAFDNLVRDPPSSLSWCLWMRSSVCFGKIRMLERPCCPSLSITPSKRPRATLARSPGLRTRRRGTLLSWYAFKRQMLLIKRDKAYYLARCIQACVMGLIVSSFFASVAPPPVPSTPEEAKSEAYLEAVYAQGRKVRRPGPVVS